MAEPSFAAHRISASKPMSPSRRRASRILHDNAELAQYEALVFDCYGDWERGMYDNLQPLFQQKTCPDADRVFEVLGRAETKLQGENKTMLYPTVLEQAYHRTTGELRLHYDAEAAAAFGASVGEWPAFGDSAEALGVLKQTGVKLVVLSNVDDDSFEQTRLQLETGWGEFDEVCTAEAIGSYKPDLRNFAYVLDMLDQKYEIPPNRVLVVANSKYHDIAPAHKIGLKAVWINREDSVIGVTGYEDVDPDWTFETMAEFARVFKEVKEDELA
ncbi:hypothetical protein Q5752_001862 [Cryptotrichosporon argae]